MSEAQDEITEKITSGHDASNSNIGLTDSSPEDKDKSSENLSSEKTGAGEQTKGAQKCQENVAPATTGKCHETATARVYTGFDAVVREERKNRKLTFGPNVKKVIKPSNILIDIYGVICSWNFAKTLKTYALKNMGSYLADNVNDKKTKDTIGCLREQAAKDKAAGIEVLQIAPATAPDAQLVDTATASILWMMEKKHKSTSSLIARLTADMWSKAYDSGNLKTHAYPEVVDSFNYWRFEEFIKIYSYASGAPDGQRQFLRSSELGDLTRFIANCLNASGGYKHQAEKFKSVAFALREPNMQNLLYITDHPEKAKNAIKAGLRSLVVNRDNKSTDKYSAEKTQGLTMVTTLADIEFIDDPNNAAPMNCC